MLKKLASEPDPLAPGWTRAGRALQKHGYRSTGSIFPRVTGPPTYYNGIAQRIVEEILDDPMSVIDLRWKRRYGRLVPFIEVLGIDGRKLGYRWEEIDGQYRFEGFREP